MMRPLAIVAYTLAAVVAMELAAVGTCPAEQTGSHIVVLEKLYDQQDQAFANLDVEKLLSFVDSDSYTFVDEKGKRLSFSEYRDALRKVLASRRNINQTTKVKDAQVHDGKMVAYIEEVGQFEIKDEENRWAPVNETMTSEEIWENKRGEWKIVLTKTLRLRQAIDENWLAARNRVKQEISDGWYNARRSMIYNCNYSTNGCR